jgi:predicted DNA-binding protein (MmcQ/YjbR family)
VDVEQLLRHCLAKPGAWPDNPWDQPLLVQTAERGAYMITATPTRQMSAPTTS